MTWTNDPKFGIPIEGEYMSTQDIGTITIRDPIEMTPCCPDLDAYLKKIKAELSDHCMKLMERMDACHEIEKKELTEHADKEIEKLRVASLNVKIGLDDHIK